MSSPSQGDEPKVFDVKKTKIPSSTARPLIVGHHPTMPDPMIQHYIPPTTAPAEPENNQPPAGTQFYPQMPTPPANNVRSSAHPLAPKAAETLPITPGLAVEDLKVKLPAGAAAQHKNRTIWLALAAVLLTAAVAAVFLLAN